MIPLSKQLAVNPRTWLIFVSRLHACRATVIASQTAGLGVRLSSSAATGCTEPVMQHIRAGQQYLLIQRTIEYQLITVLTVGLVCVPCVPLRRKLIAARSHAGLSGGWSLLMSCRPAYLMHSTC